MKSDKGRASELIYQKAFEQMRAYTTLSDELIEELWEHCNRIIYNKGDVIFEEGTFSRNLFFVVEGFCACYYSREGRESIMRFVKEGEFCLLSHGFLGGERNQFSVKATEYTELLSINREQFLRLIAIYPDFLNLINAMLSKYAVETEQHYYRMRYFTAEERIQNAWTSREIHSLIQHVPQYYIASYLNMAPETYAKLSSQISRKK